MQPEKLFQIQDLGDLGLACLTCISAGQHGIVSTVHDGLDEAANEVQTLCAESLSLSCVVIDCAGCTLGDFQERLLVEVTENQEENDQGIHHHGRPLPSFNHSFGRPRTPSLDERKVANVVVAKNLDIADHLVQIQALELIRTRRVFSRTAMHATSRIFLFLALNCSDRGAKMNTHLNDSFSICHYHQMQDDTISERTTGRRKNPSSDDAASIYSISSSITSRSNRQRVLFNHITQHDLQELCKLAEKVKITAEVSAYLHNIVITMRLHRFVAGGISAQATRHLKNTVKALAVLHGLTYVTPSLVSLAVRKTYLHRLVLATRETERSLRWGSDPAAVAENLRGVTVESAIEAVLTTVETPL